MDPGQNVLERCSVEQITNFFLRLQQTLETLNSCWAPTQKEIFTLQIYRIPTRLCSLSRQNKRAFPTSLRFWKHTVFSSAYSTMSFSWWWKNSRIPETQRRPCHVILKVPEAERSVGIQAVFSPTRRTILMARKSANLGHHLHQSLHVLQYGPLKLHREGQTKWNCSISSDILDCSCSSPEATPSTQSLLLILLTRLLTTLSSSSITTAMPW